MDCIFCKIVDKNVPAEVVFENEEVLAFKDIKPSAPTHILFIPKKHIDRLDSLKPDQTQIIASLYSAILELSQKEGLREAGFKTKIHVGSGGGQEVFHLHIHLLSQKKIGV